MKLIHQEWVCLISEHDLYVELRSINRDKGSTQKSILPIWRHFQILGTQQAILLELSTVTEAQIDVSDSVGINTVRFGFAWEDLEDSAFICKMLAREQFSVGSKVLGCLDMLKKHKPKIIGKLCSA